MSWYSLIMLRMFLVAAINSILLLLIKIPSFPAVYNYFDKALQTIERKTVLVNGYELTFKNGIEWDFATSLILSVFLIIIPLTISILTSRYHIVWEKAENSEKSYVSKSSADLLASLVKFK